MNSLLTLGHEASAVEEIARTPVLLSEARAALPALRQRATQAAGKDGVGRVIGRRLAILPTPQKSEAEWAVWWADYVAILGDLPEAALEAGMDAYLRDPAAEWMPLPGRLRALALETPNFAVRSYDRARKALEAAAPREALAPPPRADVAEVRRMLEEFRAGRVKRDPMPAPPPVSGPVNETGLTREMRIHLGIEPEDPIAEGEA